VRPGSVRRPPAALGRRPHTRELLRARTIPRQIIPVSPERIPELLTRLPSVRGTAQKIRQPGKAGPRPYGPGVKPLTPAQKTLLLWLVSSIRAHGGFLTRPEGEIAAETGLSRATVITAIAELRARDLVESAPGRNRDGGTASMRFRLHATLRRLFAGYPLSKKSTPIPVRVEPETSEVPCGAEVWEEGRAARADLMAALRAALTPRAGLSDADYRVIRHVAVTLPERWHQRAVQLAEHAASPGGSSIVAVGAWLRQELANTLRAAWVTVPSSWRVKASGESKLVLLREANGWSMKRPTAKELARATPVPPPADDFAATKRAKGSPLTTAGDAARDYIRALLRPGST
jgi:hypothetical protein